MGVASSRSPWVRADALPQSHLKRKLQVNGSELRRQLDELVDAGLLAFRRWDLVPAEPDVARVQQ